MRGVHWNRAKNRWMARIWIPERKRYVHLGSFRREEGAIAAVEAAWSNPQGIRTTRDLCSGKRGADELDLMTDEERKEVWRVSRAARARALAAGERSADL